MKTILPFPLNRRKAPSTLLGLEWDEGRLDGVVLRRTNGSLQVLQRFNVALSLDPFTNDVELVGREILNHLEAAGVRERRCAVVLPLKWVLTVHAQLPELPEADLAELLRVEAERGFPTDPAELQVATSRWTSPAGTQHALLVGVPRSQIERLEQVLRAARLRPVSFALGIAGLHAPGTEMPGGALSLALGEGQVGLQISCGGGVAALRALEGALEGEGDQRRVRSERVEREARITLGQLPPDVREAIQRIRVFGRHPQVQALVDEIRPRFASRGISVEAVTHYSPDEFGRAIPADTAVSAAFSVAARRLTAGSTPLEFLPPRISGWEQVTARYTSGRLRTAGSVAAAILLVVFAAFLVQQWQLARLRSQWSAMSAQVTELQDVQNQILKYRPWYDDSFRYLSILKDLTTAFPEDGSVTARTLEIRELGQDRDTADTPKGNAISCSGNAANYAALQKMVHQLGALSGVSDLNVPTRGKTPIQFTLDFQLHGGAASEN